MPRRTRTVYRGPLLVLFVLFLGWHPDRAQAQGFRWSPPESLPSLAQLNPWLDNMERIALTDSDPGKRSEAAYWVAFPGTLWVGSGAAEPPANIRYPGIVARLARIWRQGNHPNIIPLIAQQAERADAAALLEEIAQEPP